MGAEKPGLMKKIKNVLTVPANGTNGTSSNTAANDSNKVC